MARLRIEVDDNLATRLFIDDEQVSVLQMVQFSADRNEFLPKLRVELPDVDLGWKQAELLKKLGYAEITFIPLGEEKI